MSHVPVMCSEVLEALAPKDGDVYVDGTFGAGGYTKAILKKAHCKVIAIDRDESAFKVAQDLAGTNHELVPVHGAFGEVEAHLQKLGIRGIDGFVLDLGVSSMQIDDGARGFSFLKDGPLDMRMDRAAGRSAAQLINDLSEKELADIIWKYGEEKFARKIAKAIIEARARKPIETTLAFVDVIVKALPASSKKYAIHPATRTFQALRIAVNGELDQLEAALASAPRILKTGGRLVIVSFHSLEDSIVKKFFRETGPTRAGSRHLPEAEDKPVLFHQPVKKAQESGEQECRMNIRARSAKLRWGIRTNERIAA